MITILAKLIAFLSQRFNLGSGGTWPGEIALRLDPQILTKIAPKNIILVAGTNGKTTTSLMIKTMLKNSGLTVVHNASGANLLNGVVSAIVTSPKSQWGVFEIDENSLPIVLKFVQPKIVVLLNLFRDQLDRYGEVDVIAEKWERALKNLVFNSGNQAIKMYQRFEPNTGNQYIKQYQISIIANSDDPLIAHLTKSFKNVLYFGLNDPNAYLPKMEHATDSIFCLHCGGRLSYKGLYYSHIGVWYCEKCGEKRPEPKITTANYPLPGLYNRYNTLAAVAVAKSLNLSANLSGFSPAFGRQEEIAGKKIFLSKNPAGFNESLRTVLENKPKKLLFVLNDRIPDGRDVSWIWDVDFEMIGKKHVLVSGDRALDLALRLKYAGVKAEAVDLSVGVEKADYILPTYSAMLEVRKILTGKKIL